VGLAAGLVVLASQKELQASVRKGADILAGRMLEQGFRTTALWIRDHLLRRIQGMSPIDSSCVAPGLYVGGQQYRHGLERMALEGITATLNLRERTDDAARGLAMQKHLWLPAVDDTPPTLEQLTHASDFIRGVIEKGEGVYVHCKAGVGRAPTTAAAYLVSTGLTAAEAWDRIRRVRPFIRPKPIQIEQLDRFYTHFWHDGPSWLRT
jgi:protein-tyrosine phosphatase